MSAAGVSGLTACLDLGHRADRGGGCLPRRDALNPMSAFNCGFPVKVYDRLSFCSSQKTLAEVLARLVMKAWRILRWNDLFENNKSRCVETLSYFLQPNKLDGEGMGLLRLQPDAWEIYGVFGYLKILASRSERGMRGWLYRNGSPLTVERIHALTGIPIEKIERTLKFTSTAPMDWMAYDEVPRTPMADNGQHEGTSGAHHGHLRDTISPGLSTDKGLTDINKKTKKPATPEEAKQQSRQFSATQEIVTRLEGISEEDRTLAEERELKKMRALIRQIQKKQSAGDFKPVEEVE